MVFAGWMKEVRKINDGVQIRKSVALSKKKIEAKSKKR